MFDEIVEKINKIDDFDTELFITIIDEEDEFEKAKMLEKTKRTCKQVGRLKEFTTLLNAYINKFAQDKMQELSNKTTFTGQPLSLFCGRYIATDRGVEIEVSNNNNKHTINVCSHPILPIERLVNIDSGCEKINVAFFKDKKWQNVIADCLTLYNKNSITVLADRGVMVTSENSRDIVKYIAEVVAKNDEVIPLYDSISRVGWIHENTEFAPYIEDIKYDGDKDFENIYKHICTSGSYEKWLEHIAELRQNINIRLLMATSFASPLIEIVGALPFVLHLWGTSGFGKTVTLMVAMSIWGNPEMGCLTRTMNMTANAMARTSAFLYSLPFAADELQQIKSKWDNYDNLVMYLCEGIDRGRAKARGGVEEVRTWKNAFIFTGEEPVTKQASGGGVKNRVIEVEVEEQIIKNGNLTANLVKDNHGFAGKIFIAYIKTLDKKQMQEEYRTILKTILEETDTTEKQAMSMALIMLGDRLSCRCIFKDETPLVLKDVEKYLCSAKSVDVGKRAYEWILGFIAENQIRFQEDENKGALWGKIENNFVMINKNVLAETLAKNGYDYTAITKAWGKDGYIERNSQGYFVHQRKVHSITTSFLKVHLPQNENWEQIATMEKVDKDKLPF